MKPTRKTSINTTGSRFIGRFSDYLTVHTSSYRTLKINMFLHEFQVKLSEWGFFASSKSVLHFP